MANTGNSSGGSCGIGGEAPFSERPMVAERGQHSKPGTACLFKLRLPMPIPERRRRWRPDSQNDQRRRHLVAQRAERPKLFMAFHSPTRIMERFPASVGAGTGIILRTTDGGNNWVSRRITHSARRERFLRPCPSAMQTPGRLSATLASSSNHRWRHPVEQSAKTVTFNFLYGVSFTDANTGTVVVYENPDGMILRTTTR